MAPLSYLFVPATRIERIDKAFAAGPHAVIVDLEDAVDHADKADARLALREWLRATSPPQTVWVRVNAINTPWHSDDLAMLAAHGSHIGGVMLAKTECASDLGAVQAALGAAPGLIALIETALGLLSLKEICRHPGLNRLAFGSADLSRDLGCDDSWDVMLPARMQLVLHSAAAGLIAPIDGVTFAIDDPARVKAEARQAARAGFGAKLCVHPAQIAPAHEGFAPTSAEVDWARRIQDAGVAGSGAQRVAGQMVDRPVLERASQILQRERLATADPQSGVTDRAETANPF